MTRPASEPDPVGWASPRTPLLQLVAAVVVVFAVVLVLGTLAATRLAERESVNDAAHTADVLANAVVQPALTEQLAAGEPAAVAAFDAVVRERILGPDVVRVKLWSTTGRVLYADEPRLIGLTFALDEEQQTVLVNPATQAEISDLSEAENEFESAERLLEVYRPVWTASGTEVLFELYAPDEPVQTRTSELARGFLGVMLSALLLLLFLLAPVVWRLAQRLSAAQRHRELLLQRAVDASTDERRRIAATLHDGPVQELVATSYAVAGAAARATSAGREPLAAELSALGGTVRGTIGVLRTLLVDIYPPSLATAGVAAALLDLSQSTAGKGVDVRLDIDPAAADLLDAEHARLVYRVTQECLRNAVKHAAPCTVTVCLRPADASHVVLDVVDDGPGFDTASLDKPEHGHFGLRVMSDLATLSRATLEVASAPGAGTHWRLAVPRMTS